MGRKSAPFGVGIKVSLALIFGIYLLSQIDIKLKQPGALLELFWIFIGVLLTAYLIHRLDKFLRNRMIELDHAEKERSWREYQDSVDAARKRQNEK